MENNKDNKKDMTYPLPHTHAHSLKDLKYYELIRNFVTFCYILSPFRKCLLLFYMCDYFACTYMLSAPCVERPQKRGIRFPRPGVTDDYELAMWVLVTKLWSSARAISAFNP